MGNALPLLSKNQDFMHWYEDEVRRLEDEKSQLQFQPGTVFYGSSSIRQWITLQHDFKEMSPINLGFGGSTLKACVWYFDRIFRDLDVQSIILYAGDNDLGDGERPEDIFLLFKKFKTLVKEKYGDIPIGYISIKPSISRKHILDKIKLTNALIESELKESAREQCYINVFDHMLDASGNPDPTYFLPDGLHLNEAGYQLWKKVVWEYATAGKFKM
jgi:hypothetical protein